MGIIELEPGLRRGNLLLKRITIRGGEIVGMGGTYERSNQGIRENG